MNAKFGAEAQSVSSQALQSQSRRILDIRTNTVHRSMNAGKSGCQNESRPVIKELIFVGSDAKIQLKINGAEQQPLHLLFLSECIHIPQSLCGLNKRQDWHAWGNVACNGANLISRFSLRQDDSNHSSHPAQFQITSEPFSLDAVDAEQYRRLGDKKGANRFTSHQLLFGRDCVLQVDNDRIGSCRKGFWEARWTTSRDE
jgi:hypothetical protein